MHCSRPCTRSIVHQRCTAGSVSLPRLCKSARSTSSSGRALGVILRAQEDGKSFEITSLGLAPAKPKTPYGEMLEYYLKMQPELFKSAVEDQLRRLKEEKDAKEEAAGATGQNTPAEPDKSQLTLYKRMEELRASEVRATLEDLMYVSILEKFIGLGVEMLPRMDGFVDAGPTNLKALTESIHSKEALELVREHLMGVMGPALQNQFSNAALKMSKFQMAQVYAASVMFGYFLRRVDTRFQLEKAVGSLDISREDAVARLQRLFSQVDSADAPWEEPITNTTSTKTPTSDSAPSTTVSAELVDSSTLESSTSESSGDEDTVVKVEDKKADEDTVDKVTAKKDAPEEKGQRVSDWVVGASPAAAETQTPPKRQKSALRKYVEGFDQQTMVEMARIVSMEGAALVERQTSALLGDIKKLTMQVQEAVGTDVTSMQDVMDRMAQAVRNDKIETLTMTVGTQRRAVLEAVAFGAFLREIETGIDSEWGLLTIKSQLMLPGNDNDS